MKSPIRYLKSAIESDSISKEKITFISGPRQVGKSTLAKSLLTNESNYFLYDDEDFLRNWAKSPEKSISSRGPGVVVLDEIHKDQKWKTKIKGIYDKYHLPFVVTGSTRLDLFRKGSDSLLGRYLPYHLHPFSVAESEISITPDEIFKNEKIIYPWKDLLTLGGFPEPFFSGSQTEALRWSRLRLDRLVLEDSREIRNISDLNSFRVLISLLSNRVGSLLSTNSLREDVSKAYATVGEWLKVLESLYYSFTIKPYSKNISRALKAEPKLFLYDIMRIPPDLESKRLENLTALHLLKLVNFWTDTAQGEFELRFVRDKEKREVDFLVTKDEKPWMLVECKSNSTTPSQNLIHFNSLLKPKFAIQLVTKNNYHREYSHYNVQIMSYEKFAAGLL